VVDAAATAEARLDGPSVDLWGTLVGEAAERDRVFVGLKGELGAGKTRLVTAACRGAGSLDRVSSPTFALVHEYRGPRGPIWHVDLYRISGPGELPALGWEDMESGAGPVFVEWSDRAGGMLPADRWEIELGFLPGGPADVRRVRCRSIGGAPPVPPFRGATRH